MRYKRLSLLLVISLVFFLVVSLILICTWIYYYFYDREKKAEIKRPDVEVASKNFTRDSLQDMYTASIGSFDSFANKESNDSLHADFNNKLTEFYKLRNEITGILRDRSNPDDLDLARKKIGTLQQKIEELRSRTVKIEYENKRLNALLQQLSNELKGQELQVKRNLGSPGTNPGISPIQIPNFTISDIQISAMKLIEDKDEETTESDKVEKLVGSFIVKNSLANGNRNELMVVVEQPDGRVLQNSSWESGSFETREGKKIYSSKIIFDYNKGESKQLTFSIKGEEFQKGIYTVQVYQNGMVIGKGSKRLM